MSAFHDPTDDPSGPLDVLVIEDTAAVAGLIRQALEADGCRIEVVTNLADARRRLVSHPPDVVVLDVELPDGSGLELLRDPPAVPQPPTVVLSSRQEELDRVIGLELGAEDYMVKPFFPRELAVRVRRAASRQTSPAAEDPHRLRHGPLVIDRTTREAALDDATVELTAREFDLLAHLAASPRQVFSREELLGAVWQSSSEWQSAKTVTEHIRRIRNKIERDPSRPRWIITVGRSGYRFEPRQIEPASDPRL